MEKSPDMPGRLTLFLPEFLPEFHQHRVIGQLQHIDDEGAGANDAR